MEKNKRDKRLEVRVTPFEEEQIKSNAKQEGKSISTFVVDCCLQEGKSSVDANKMREKNKKWNLRSLIYKCLEIPRVY